MFHRKKLCPQCFGATINLSEYAMRLKLSLKTVMMSDTSAKSKQKFIEKCSVCKGKGEISK